MSRYTFTLREVISTFGEDEVKNWFSSYDLNDFLTNEEINIIEIRNTWTPEKLAQRIVDHYMLREIGYNSIGAWKLAVKDLMNEVMETYAPLIYSASIKYDPLVNVDYTENYNYKGNTVGSSTSSSSSNGSGLTVSSDTPQGNINKHSILQGQYASSTSANETDNQINDNSDSESNENNSYIKTIRGNSGVSATAQKMIEQYRNNIRALNTEIMYKLEPLFMGVY